MAPPLDSDVLAALAKSRLAIAIAAKFVFPEATFGLWTGRGTLTWQGQAYKGVDRMLAFDGGRDASGNVAEGGTLSLSGLPSDKLDPDWQSQMESYTYDNAPCIVAWLAFDAQSHELLGHLKVKAFEIDTILYRKGPVDEDGRHLVDIQAALETASRNLTDATHWKRSDADHRQVNDENDLFLDRAGIGARFKIRFGRITQ